MTAPLTAAESFLLLLDDLGAAKPNGATAAVLLKHAATHIRGLLERVRELEVVDCEIADDEIDDVLRQAALQCPEHGVLCKGAGCCCADRHPQDPSRPEVAATLPREDYFAGPGQADLSHLPPVAAPGKGMCLAESPRDPGRDLAYWSCTARAGHPERWHAEHRADGTPYADSETGAAWPVAVRETGLPPWALVTTQAECGATIDRSPGSGGVNTWLCNAERGHEPLDHVVFAAMNSRMAGAVLARWASVRPGQQRPELCAALSPVGEMTCDLMAGHLSRHEQLDAAGGVIAHWPNHEANGHALRPPEDVPGQEASGEGPSIAAGRQHHGPPHAGNTGEAGSPGRAPGPFRLTGVEDGEPG